MPWPGHGAGAAHVAPGARSQQGTHGLECSACSHSLLADAGLFLPLAVLLAALLSRRPHVLHAEHRPEKGAAPEDAAPALDGRRPSLSTVGSWALATSCSRRLESWLTQSLDP